MRILVALAGVAVLALIARGLAWPLPGWTPVVGYFALHALLGQVGPWAAAPKAVAGDGDDDEAILAPELPISGPIGRLGRRGLVALFFTTQMLLLFNPFQLVQVTRQWFGNAALQRRERATGSDGRDRPTEVRYRLPFDGEWLLCNGGPTPKTSHSWDVLGQRFALDFVVADAEGRRHVGRGTRVTDYLAYGCDIVAAADGEVVAVEQRIGDAPLVGWGVCDVTARSFIGNHVLIRHAEGEYALYAHLVRGSVPVAVGQRVRCGQRIGRCGHSGHSTEPHLHFHVQDAAELFGGMGRPIRFRDCTIDGRSIEDGQMPTAGQRLQSTVAITRVVADASSRPLQRSSAPC
ncbi:M23 family metallopeptidase [Wenzhouxiangella sp. XN79A]|uniref:M23 family metallopeptidase n=1 Tax=Wenzhouxiangella sp. XN79A TaxID=2724193 RepID=UPI001F0F3D98|nr:M23 family metallopeptidase [Wenzhouxiangella sp. XN79A]